MQHLHSDEKTHDCMLFLLFLSTATAHLNWTAVVVTYRSYMVMLKEMFITTCIDSVICTLTVAISIETCCLKIFSQWNWAQAIVKSSPSVGVQTGTAHGDELRTVWSWPQGSGFPMVRIFFFFWTSNFMLNVKKINFLSSHAPFFFTYSNRTL